MREIWRCTVVLWERLCTALLPRRPLREMPAILARFLDHLGRSTERTRERRAERFLRILAAEDG